MIRLREFIQSGGNLSQRELFAMIKEHMLMIPVSGQRLWLRQMETSVDGYVGERQIPAVRRVKNALAHLYAEVAAQPSAGPPDMRA